MYQLLGQTLNNAGIELTPDLLQTLKGESYLVRVPKKVLNNMDKYFSRKELWEIHPDLEVAKELCLLTLSNLCSTFLDSQVDDDVRVKEGYKRLYSRILEKQVQYDGKITSPYSKIINYWIINGVIEMGREGSMISGKATEYRLTRGRGGYFAKGIDTYELKTKIVRRMQVKKFNANFERAISTNIGKNSLRVRSKMIFPSTEEVTKHLQKEMMKEGGYYNKKGKKLVKLGKHSKKEYPESDFVYLEDYIARYEYLRDHMKVPIVSEVMTDARIFDCFNMMPSVIRKMLKINGMSIAETDYSALHPNITQMLYGGANEESITHKAVAEDLGLEVKKVKRMHLSFFNLPSSKMVHSPLFKYYDDKEPLMMTRIIEEKRQEEMEQAALIRIKQRARLNKGQQEKKDKNKGHAVTSVNLFMVETHMMEEVVGELNSRGIDVFYVFDAIYSTEQDKSDVVEVMNKIAGKFKVKTKAI